jgi:rod shape-determining protein MreC
MKNYFRGNSFKALLITIFVLFALMLYTASSNGGLFPNLLGAISTPMQKVSTMATNNAANAAEGVTLSKEQLLAENKQLRAEIDSLNQKLADYDTYKQENAQLRKFLEFKDENKDIQLASAAVIGRDPSDLFYNFTIDQGSSAGISVNDPVITEAGLVGWVSAVTSSYAKVTTILSPDTNVGAYDSVNRDSGVVSSNLKLADSGLIKMGYLTAANTVKEGDIILTSGLGGIYPRGLKIGKVTAVKHEEYDVSMYAEVLPFVDVKTVRDVMVITSFNGQGETLDDLDSASGGASSGSSAAGSSSSSTASSGSTSSGAVSGAN